MNTVIKFSIALLVAVVVSAMSFVLGGIHGNIQVHRGRYEFEKRYAEALLRDHAIEAVELGRSSQGILWFKGVVPKDKYTSLTEGIQRTYGSIDYAERVINLKAVE